MPALFLVTSPALAQFVETELALDVPIESRLGISGFDSQPGAIVLAGRSKDRQKHMAIYPVRADGSVASEPSTRLLLPEQVLYFDSATINAETTLVFLTPDGILELDPESGRLNSLLSIASVYRTPTRESLGHLDFVRDLNDDGLDDIVLPDFDGVRIRLQTTHGFGPEILLDIAPRLLLGTSQASYRPDQLYLYDFNLDGMRDLAVLRDNQFHVFDADSEWSFASHARRIPIDIELAADDEAARFEENLVQIDQSDFRSSRISDVTDLNDDGLPDIITFTAISSGVFDKRSEYGVHLASWTQDGIRYRDPADAKIASRGFQVGLTPIDSEGGRDLVSTSVDFGFRQVIAALFTRSLTVDVSLHRFGNDPIYTSEGDYHTETKLKLNISTGFVSVPAVRFADFNDDGLADILLQQGDDELLIREGSRSAEDFGESSWTWETTLPLDGSLIDVADANGDGFKDVLIGYGNADGEEMRNRLRVLVGQPEVERAITAAACEAESRELHC